MAGDFWTPDEERDCQALSWRQFHEKYPDRTKAAYRFKRKSLTEVGEVVTPLEEQVRILQKELDAHDRRARRREAERDFMAKAIRDAAGLARTVKAPKRTRPARRNSEEVAVLEFSDLQMGQCSHAPRLANLGFYDRDAFVERLDRLRDAIEEIVGIQRKGGITINKLIINGLGDYVEGETIFPGQGLQVDANLVEQVFVLGEHVIQRFFLPMCELFPEVEMFGVPGNHGRSSKFGSDESNWDFVCMAWWHGRMRQQKNWSLFISRPPFLAYQVFDAIHLLAHGHEIRAYNQIPFYGLSRGHGNYMKLIGQFIHYMHVGHHHNLAEVDLMFGKDIMNGSFSGASEFSVGKLSRGNQPKQLFFGLNDKGQTWEYDIRLAEFERLEPDERGLLTPVWEFGEVTA